MKNWHRAGVYLTLMTFENHKTFTNCVIWTKTHDTAVKPWSNQVQEIQVLFCSKENAGMMIVRMLISRVAQRFTWLPLAGLFSSIHTEGQSDSASSWLHPVRARHSREMTLKCWESMYKNWILPTTQTPLPLPFQCPEKKQPITPLHKHFSNHYMI